MADALDHVLAGAAQDRGALNGRVTPFTRRDLGDMIRKPRPRPATLADLIYPGKLHLISGEPESGKSTIALYWLLRAIKHGHNVVMIDCEAGADHNADLLQSFGADPALISKHLHYFPYPEVSWNDPDISALAEMLRKIRPKLAMFDSAAEMLAAAGLSENDPGEVTRFFKRTLKPIAARLGIGVILTDHDSKGGAESRYSRGSGAKLAATEVGFKAITETPFTRDQDGRLRFEITKDRPGCLHRAWTVRVTRDPLTLHWEKTRPRAAALIASGAEGSGAAGALAAVLDGTPAPIRTLVDRIVARGGIPLKYDTARKALAALYDAGVAEKIETAPGAPVKWLRRPEDPAPWAGGWPAGSEGAQQQDTLYTPGRNPA